MERERLSKFVRQDHGRVVAALAFACGDPGRAEDAVQEALARAWQHDGDIEHLSAWVARTALNEVRSGARRLGAERRAHERAARRPGRPGPAEPRLPEDELLAALHQLPARQREIVALHYLLDLSVADVAEALQVATGTVKTQLHRAREALRVELAGDPPRGEGFDHVG